PVEKILRHQLDEPAPLEQLRPDVPPKLAAVVRKLMAKDPARRYQTPAAAAAALTPFWAFSAEGASEPAAVPQAARSTEPEMATCETDLDPLVVLPAHLRRRRRQGISWFWLALLAAAVGLGAAGLLLLLSG